MHHIGNVKLLLVVSRNMQSQHLHIDTSVIRYGCWNPTLHGHMCHRECENNALFMRSKDLNFNTKEEEECVETIFNQAMECLKEEDRSLNFVVTLLPLLMRGIGVHHSGLLPILKEVIELLFQEQLIKVITTALPSVDTSQRQLSETLFGSVRASCLHSKQVIKLF